MGEWKEYKLGDVINLKRGYDLPSQTRKIGSIPIFSSSGITDFHIEPMAKGPGVITGRYGTVGQVFYSESDYWPLNTTLYVQDFKGNDPRFIYYLLKAFDFEKYSDKSAVPGINRNDVHTESVLLPPLPEQKSIASVLSSLDDKVDLLHRQNKTLESLAETLFRQWFVEEAEEGWEEITLSDIADHVKLSINPVKQPTTLFEHYSIPAFDEGQEPKKDLGREIRSNKYRVLSNTILISKLNPRTPRVWSVYGEINENSSICSTEFQVVKPRRSDNFGFIYCYLKSWNVMHELANAVGGTSGSHQRVNPDDIFNLSLRRPPIDKFKKFDRMTNDYWEKISRNRKQIRTLTRLRDTLLPKLMSGAIRTTD